MPLRIPKRPPPIRPKKDKRFEIIPTIDVVKVEELDPLSEAQQANAAKYGKKVRIWYVHKSFDSAIAEAHRREKAGVSPDRIELRLDGRAVWQAIERGDFEVVEVED